MHVQLREGDFNVGFAEGFFNIQTNIRRRGNAHIVVPHPETQGKIQGAGPEIVKGHGRRRIFKHVAVAVGYGQQNFHDLVGRAAVGHADLDFPPHRAAVARPVNEPAGHKLGVGHDNQGVVKGFHHGGAHADLAYAALNAAHVHHVPGLQGAAENKDQARKKVIDDGLHAEADAHGKAAGHHGQVAQLHAQRPQHKQAEATPQGVGEGRLHGRDQGSVDAQPLLG